MSMLKNTLIPYAFAGAFMVNLAACAAPRAAHVAKKTTPSPTTAVVNEAPPQSAAPASVPLAVEVVASERMAPAPAGNHRKLSVEEQEMLRTVDPARVFHTAVAKKGIPTLTIIGPGEQRIPTLGSATLTVQAAPQALVTFATSDGGVFANQAASITVLADEQGRASTVMSAPPGTVDDVPVRVGSPSAIGTAVLLVHVMYPASPLQPVAAP